MIKVGIIGADTSDAGELLRILIRHPEVDVTTLYSPSYAGRQITACHHGFIGEQINNFTDNIDPSSLDMIFLSDNSEMSDNILENSEKWTDLRIIDLSPERSNRRFRYGMEFGLSEINRKPLVRGARLASIPKSASALALISLYPLALNNLLPPEMEITIFVPGQKAKTMSEDEISAEINSFISSVQSDYTGKIHVRLRPTDPSRTMKVKTVIRCPLAVAEVNDIFDSVYDDHSFTFTSLTEIDRREVEGTQKCIVSFSKPAAGLLEIDSIGDCYLRGGSGDAVHVMNLFFSLDEKVGLQLKPSVYGDEADPESIHASWFA